MSGNVISLGTSDTIVAVLGASVTTNQPTYLSSFVDASSDTPGNSEGSLNGTTPVTLVSSPSSGIRQVDTLRIYNNDTASVQLTVYVLNGSNKYYLGLWTVLAGGWVDVLGSPTAQGGLGGGGGDMLATQVNAEVNITGTVTLTMSAWNHCTATSADYAVNLPALSSNYGKFLAVIIDPTSTKLVTVTAAGTDKIDGQATRIMWANEVAILYADQSSAQWTKVGGKSIPMWGALGVNGNQTFGNSTWTALQMGTSLALKAPAAFQTTGTYRMTVLRPGLYHPQFVGYLSYNNSSSTTAIVDIYKNGGHYFQNTCVYTGTQSNSFNLGEPLICAVGDYFQPYGYYYAGSFSTTFLYNDNGSGIVQNQFTLREIPTW